MDIVIDISIDKDEVYKNIVDGYETEFIDESILTLISEHKEYNKIKSVVDTDKLMKIAESLDKSTNFDIFTITDIYSMDSIYEINKLVYPYNYAYIVKLIDKPFDYTFYIMTFEKRQDSEIDSKIVNNIDKIRDLIYLTVANAEVVLRKR